MENNYRPPKSTIRTFFNLFVIAFLFLVGFSIFYYFVIFLPSKEQVKQDLQRQEQQLKTMESHRNKVLLQQCLDAITQKFSNALKENKTPINNEAAKIILNENNKQKDECFKKYPQ